MPDAEQLELVRSMRDEAAALNETAPLKDRWKFGTSDCRFSSKEAAALRAVLARYDKMEAALKEISAPHQNQPTHYETVAREALQ